MKFLSFNITNTEPLKITDIGMSRNGEAFSVNYIPGSTLKGAVINALASEYRNNPDVFERAKKELLSCETFFLNSYITDGKREMFPSPMGFYEDKTNAENTEKPLDNVVVNNEFRESFKRAKLGTYSFVDGNRIIYASLNKSDALNINIGIKSVYRTDYICSGYRFAGYIGFSDKVSDETIALTENILRRRTFRLGSSRSAGYGKVKVDKVDYLKENDYPFSSLSVTGKEISGNVVYMMLLSPLTMRNEYGEICGINEKTIEEKAGCSLVNHQVSRASTSVIKMSGINRTWKSRTPEYRMYAAGSVFRLEFESTPERDKLREIEISGLGIGKNDGYGRVIFFEAYDKITAKFSYNDFIKSEAGGRNVSDTVSVEDISEEDIRADIKIIAAGIADVKIADAVEKYIYENESNQNTASNSQAGVFRSIYQKYRYSYNDAEREIKNLISHIREKEASSKKHSSRGSQMKLMDQITEILDSDIFSVLGVDEDICGMRISELIDSEKQGLIKINLLERLMIKKNRGAGKV